MRDRFDEMGRVIARDLPSKPDEGQRRAQEARLLEDLAQTPDLEARGRRPFRLAWGLAMGAALAALVLAMIWAPWSSGPRERPFCVERGRGTVAHGAWIHGSNEKATTLDFEDGSEVTTEGRTRVQLTHVSRKEVRVLLGNGKIRSRVRPHSARWSFEAGAYRTEVLGTTLSVEWRPGKGRLVVSVEQGRVWVRGGVIAPKGMLVAKGQRLEIESGQLALHGGPAAATQADAGTHDSEAASTPRAPKLTPLSMRWRALARKGQHRKALRAAQEQGFARLLQRLRSSDLLLLADAARLAGNPGRAADALLACRRRYPSTAAARQAAFRLGRVAAEGQRSPRAAARWFRRFLKEAPQSPLRADAMGRLILALQQGGKKKAAAKVARQYLSQYPQGPYGAAAKRCLRGKKR
ncbi:MAG: tetratricopeptide repeat protein [Deltaproteobacteria bacterium]|nr:tetratricopeptide repeat protein [Deltaproteobacteria bacterium]